MRAYSHHLESCRYIEVNSILLKGSGLKVIGTLSMHILNGNGDVSSVEFIAAHA